MRPRRNLTLVTGPTAEPVTLDEAKNWARIDATDQDGYLAGLLTAAIQHCEEYLRRALISRTLKLSVDLVGCPGGEPWWDGVREGAISSLYGGLPIVIELPMPPISAISSVTTYDTSNASSSFSSSNYYLNNNRLILNFGSSWPSNMRQHGAAEITYVAGYGSTGTTVPMPIKQAVQIQFAGLYESRGICTEAAGVFPAAEGLLRQYRIMDYRG